MRIWIDLANSPHVPFFNALIPEFNQRGHDIEVTARDFAETIDLATASGLQFTAIGGHGGKQLTAKGGNLLVRARALRTWASNRKFDLALSHNSYSQIVAARLLKLRTITLMDYEHQPANHLAFRLAHRVVVPDSFPQQSLKKFGVRAQKVCRYHGTKEDVYLAGFKQGEEFSADLGQLGISSTDVIVVVRPPADEALYHRFENELFDQMIDWLAQQAVKVVFLPRNTRQRERYGSLSNFVTPEHPLHGANLIAASDLVISAGGTMNREAAALGVPAATIYAGKWAAVDEELCRKGRLLRLTSTSDFAGLRLEKKVALRPSGNASVRNEVVECVLGG